MKTTTESVLVVTTEKGEVVAIVRNDSKLHKNLLYRVSDAKISDIEGFLNGSVEKQGLVSETGDGLVYKTMSEKVAG